MTAETAVLADRLGAAFLVQIDFAEGTTRFWTGSFAADFGGHTWAPVGGLGRIELSQETERLEQNAVRIGIRREIADNGLDPVAFHAAIVQERRRDVTGRRVIVFEQIFDDTLTAAGDPQVEFIGRASHFEVERSGPDTIQITLECEPVFAGLTPINALYTAEDQASRFPSPIDRGFEFIPLNVQGRVVDWPRD